MPFTFRPTEDRDIASMAAIRAREWGTEAYWQARIASYLRGELSPQKALAPRAAFVAVRDDLVVGFVAGHRTRRYECKGELEWINVVDELRGHGIAGKLLATMATWFVEQDALRVCVDVDPKNTSARALYTKYGAQRLNDHWLVWEDVRTILGTIGSL